MKPWVRWLAWFVLVLWFCCGVYLDPQPLRTALAVLCVATVLVFWAMKEDGV
jgi:hypothetical protein